MRRGGAQIDARVPLLFNRDIAMGVVFPSAPDPVYVADGDADQLLYIHRGGGRLRSLIGDVVFAQGDYVYVPRGLLHRFEPDAAVGAQHWLWMSLTGGVHVPRQWRNDVGQLRMDAPYCHRDFKRPVLAAPYDEGIRELVVRRNGAWHGFVMDHSRLDVVGWDGTVYPWAFPILAFQPRVSSVHLPPTWHGTFAARGALICSFVPRPLDFGPTRSRARIRTAPRTATNGSSTATATSRRARASGRAAFRTIRWAWRTARIPARMKADWREPHERAAVMADTEGSLQATAAALGIEIPSIRIRSCSAPISRRRRS